MGYCCYKWLAVIMQINRLQIIDNLVTKYPQARKPMSRWVTITTAAEWRNFSEVKDVFRAADYVGPYTVFDIGGNKWRLITIVEYPHQLVVVTHALTHREYSENKWKI